VAEFNPRELVASRQSPPLSTANDESSRSVILAAVARVEGALFRCLNRLYVESILLKFSVSIPELSFNISFVEYFNNQK
jgi:hypothetical protein